MLTVIFLCFTDLLAKAAADQGAGAAEVLAVAVIEAGPTQGAEAVPGGKAIYNILVFSSAL